nr:hypothetical protein [Homoserinibacter gongjuensis]
MMPIIFQMIMITIVGLIHAGSPSQSGPWMPTAPSAWFTSPYW